MSNQSLTDLFTKGYYSDQFCLDVVSMFEGHTFPDCVCDDKEEMVYAPESQKLLDDVTDVIVEKYIKQVSSNYKIIANGMWSGVDYKSSGWHSDYEDVKDPLNTNFLIYLDDGEPYGNAIQFTNGYEEFSVTHKPNQFVWINQTHAFKHKGVHNGGDRRLLTFEFFIPGLGL